jgi:glycerate kinase
VDVVLCPLTRAEAGCLDAVVASTDGEEREAAVVGPLGDPLDTRFGVVRPRLLSGEGGLADAVIQSLGGLLLGVPFPLREESGGDLPGTPGPLAFIDGSLIIGPDLTDPATHEPQLATSHGIGRLLRAAISVGHDRIVLALDESAALDAGIGALSALGVVFRDEGGDAIDVRDSLDLLDVASVDTSEMLAEIRRDKVAIVAAAANERRLVGQTSPVWALRERAAWYAEQPNTFHEAFDRFARLLGEEGERHPAANHAGSGAGGGLAFALAALLDAPIVPGFDLTKQLVGLEHRVERADAILTAMGPREVDARSDPVTGLLGLAAERNVPVLMLDTRPAEDETRSIEADPCVRVVRSGPVARLEHGLGDLVVEAERLVGEALAERSGKRRRRSASDLT